MLECVANISEGRDPARLEALANACGPALLDRHSDPHHHRSVFTMVGDEGARTLSREAVRSLDVRDHEGVHPRIGVVDVVPFVPLGAAVMAEAIAARDRFAHWIWETLQVPAFLYDPERTLPEVRRVAFAGGDPDVGRGRHESAGAVAVGARPVLVAYNLWLAEPDVDKAADIARSLRRAEVRALALRVGEGVQVSMNLVNPSVVGPMEVYDEVAEMADISRAELVGLVPDSVLEAVPSARWAQLDLARTRTIEFRLSQAGL